MTASGFDSLSLQTTFWFILQLMCGFCGVGFWKIPVIHLYFLHLLIRKSWHSSKFEVAKSKFYFLMGLALTIGFWIKYLSLDRPWQWLLVHITLSAKWARVWVHTSLSVMWTQSSTFINNQMHRHDSCDWIIKAIEKFFK